MRCWFGSRYRTLLEYQYANAQETATISFRFLDAYYNNGPATLCLIRSPSHIGFGAVGRGLLRRRQWRWRWIAVA